MQSISFYKNLGIYFIASVFLFALLGLAIPVYQYLDLFIISNVFLIAYCILLFLLANRSKKSNVKNQFIHLILYNVFIKIILAFFIVFAYFKMAQPEDKIFILPFVLCYFVYSIFETIFLSKMANDK